MTRKRTTTLNYIISHYGGVSAMAEAFGVSRQAISKWDRVPIRHVPRITKETKIPRQILRPDLYEDD
jgi:DNA-binding transcriptional regulator YdaS (Cro superfamily)